MMATETLNTEVLVVGGGPVGMCLAAELNYRNVKCVLVEKKEHTADIPKATLVNVRTMEHFRRLGLAKKVKDSITLPRDSPVYNIMGTGVVKNKQIAQMMYGSWSEAVGETGQTNSHLHYKLGCSKEYTVMCPQLILEPVLKEHLNSSDNVTSYWGWELEGLTQNTGENGSVIASMYKKDDSGKKLTITAKFMVGCDGGSSYTRKLIGVHTYGQFVLHKAFSVYIKSQELKDIVYGKPGYYLVSNRKVSGVMVTVDIEKGDFLIYSFMHKDDTKKYEFLKSNPAQFVTDFVGKEIEHTIKQSSHWETHALLATKYRVGRVFLCGDAAHQVPVGGIGMNTGIVDAADLAWKIDAMLKGWGGCFMLDSYQIERRTLADKTQSYVIDSGEIVGTAISRYISSLLVHLPVVSTLFGKHVVKSVRENLQAGTTIVFAFQYSNSNIILHNTDNSQHDTGVNILSPFLPLAKPGRRAPHVVLDDLPTIHDLFGKDHTLLIIDGSESDCRDLQEEAEQRKMPLKVYNVKGLPQIVDIYTNNYYIVRPDGIISWCSNSQPNRREAVHIISVICGCQEPKCLPTQKVSYCTRSPYSFPLAFELASIGYLAVIVYQRTPLSLPFSYFVGLNAITLLKHYFNARRVSVSTKVSRHKASALQSYGTPTTSLHLDEKYVSKFGPSDVLVRVHAASVNHIDVGMTMGYGSALISANFQRRNDLPRVLGRDCAGEVVAVGEDVTKFIAGDLVYAACPWSRDGSHAQYVAVDENHVSHMPTTLSFAEAASLPWVACTVWSALVTRAGLTSSNAANKKVLVHGGSGGVGSFAIQLLKAWGAKVTTTCSSGKVELVKNLNAADIIIDYTNQDFSQLRGYDVVLDTVGYTQNYEARSLNVLKRFGNAKYLSIRSPYLRFVNYWGVLVGSLMTQAITFIQVLVQRLLHGRGFFYIVAQPSGRCLDEVRKLVDAGRIKPVLSKTDPFPLEKISEAYELVRDGRAGGKVIVEMP
ncbi:4-methyl-5-nitrocatechol 5-monooxygenase-like [Dysidea avara]|uniref:4-methyl-5-nitrocatechol 5-monooxygenase-like n=1 Tax=Dysidea avara TaxID=196820 RepID=UPI00331A59B6